MEWRASTVSVLLLALTGIQVNSTMVYPSNHVNSICSMWGDFHFKTFDGDVYQFPGMCEYNLVSDCQSLIHQFSVHVKRTENSTGPKISRVSITINDIGVELTEKQVLVNEEKVKLPVQLAGILVEENTIYTRLYSKMGITVKWNKNDAVMVELDSKYSNRTCGLCGDFNGVPVYNEFIESGRRLGYVEFGNKHRVRNPMHACEDPFENADEKNVVNKCEKVQTDCADLLKDEKWSSCRWVLNPEPYIKACTNDICSRQPKDKDSKTSAICASLSEYSRLCSHAGGAPPNWRTAAFCAVTCPYNMVHSESGSPCMDTCSHQNTNSLCEEHNTDGCFCPPGTVFDDISNKGCIPSEKCKCKHDHIYSTGEIIRKDEGECVCEEGEWVCTSIPGPGLCSLEEGSHFTTFDGKEFTFNGDCHYVLSKDCNQTKFSILGEIAPCYTRQTDTCLKSVVVLFYNDMKNPLVIKADGSVQHNADILLPYITADFTVFMPSSFHVMLQITFGLQVQIQLVPLMQVYITVDQSLQGKTCGLCGNFNKVLSDDLKTPQGVVEGTPVSFANSWKSSFNCPDRTERMDDPCSYSSDSENFAQHWCSTMQDKASLFAKCHTTVNPDSYYKRCKYSSCSCEKSEDCLCAVVSSYVRACAAKGISLQGWRKIVCEKYTKNCPASQNYSYQLQTCQRTCLSLASERQSCSVDFVPVDGCACPDGLYQDENGLCVPSEKCPCFHTGQKINPGKSITVRDEHCICIKGKLHCRSWKNQTQVCSSPKVFFNCSTAAPDEYGLECAKTCSQQKVDCFSVHCQSGCQCPSGLLDDGRGHCVKPDNCPCKHDGQFYIQGSTITSDCNKCTCQGGKWKCTHYECPGICTIYGSGHYRTFDQQRFGFSGGCSYIAAQNNCGNKTGNFYVITENMPCGTTGTTCSKSVKILLGRTMLLLSGGTVKAADTGSGPEIRYTERNFGMYLVIDANIGLTILWDRKTTVRIILQPQHMADVCGLCGNFNGDAKDDFTTQGNLPTTNAMEFVDSWKVLSSCPDAKPDFNPCVETPNRENWAKIQCSIIKDIKGPFKSCHNKVDHNPYYDNCVKDSCACDTGGDCECFCTAVAAYAQACNEADVCVNWRTPEICPVYCDYYNTGTDDCTWHYSPCHTSCYKTCLNPNATCDNNLPNLEGCYPKCPEDKPIFDEKNQICVAECIPTTTPKPSTSFFPTTTTTTKPTTTTPKPSTSSFPTPTTTTKPTTTTPKHTTPSSPTPTTTTKPPTTTPKPSTSSFPTPTTITFTSTSTKSTTSCIICGWSDWFNVYNPDLEGGNDLETYKNIAERGKEICKEPIGVECRSVKNYNMSFEDFINKSKQVAQCNVSYGLECKKDQQKDRPFKCFDYEIRVYCCIPCSPTTTPTATTKSTTTTPKPTTPSSPTPTATTKSSTTTPKHTTPSSPTPTTTTKTTTTPKHTTPSSPTPTTTTKSTTTPKATTPSTPTSTATTESIATTSKYTTSSSPTPTATTKSTTTTPKHTTPSSPTPTVTTKSTSTTIPSSAAQTTKSIITPTATTPSTPTSTITTKSTTTTSRPTTPSTSTSTATTKSTTTLIPTTPSTPTPTTTTKSTTTAKLTTPSSPTPTATTKTTSTTIPSSAAQTTKSITTQTATTPSTPTSTITTKSTTTTTPKPTTPSTPTSTATTKSITTTPKLTTPTSPTPTTTTKSTTPKLTTPSTPTPTATTKSTTGTPKPTTQSSPTPTATTKSTTTTPPTPKYTTPSSPTPTTTTKSTTPKLTTPSSPTPTATTKSTTTPKHTTPTSPTPTTTTKSTTTPKLTTPSTPTQTATTKSTTKTSQTNTTSSSTKFSLITGTTEYFSQIVITTTPKPSETPKSTTSSSPTSTATTKSTSTTQKPTTPSTPTPTVSTKSTTTTPNPTTSSSPTPTATTTSTTTQKPTILPSPTPTTKSTTTTLKATTPSSPTSTSTTKSITTSKPTTPSSPTTTATTRSTTTTTPKPTTPSTPTLTATTKSTTTTSKPTVQSSPTPTSTIKSTITTAKPTTPSTPTTTPGHTTSTRSISTTTATPPDCPEWAKNTNETFYLCKCMMARCIKDNNIEVIPFQCPPLQNITCENGKKPVLVEDEYGCCKYYACDCFCEGWGDPHYKTFDGKFYSHQGNCTYTLMEEIRPQTHLKIYIDSVYCDLVERVSCPRSIIVSYNKLVIKLTNHNLLGGADLEAFENNVKLRLPYAYNGVRVISSSLDLFLSIPLLGVNISFGATGFGINLPFQHFGNNTQGHCGTCNNNKADDCMIPGGILVDDCAVMADYWPASGVNGEVCTPPSALPSVPVIDKLPSKPCKGHPDCYLLNNELFKACHSHIPPQNFILSCQYDSCHMENPAVVCISLQTYARACLQLGICINWRNYTNLCNIECPADKVFNPCGPAEPPSCADIPEQKNIKMRTEGCFCPEGTLLFNKNTKVCVNKCGCLDSSKTPRDLGEVFEYNCEECICEKNSKSVSCKPKACLDVSPKICTEPGFVLVNVTNPSDPCCSKQVCNCDVSMCPPMDKKCPIGHNPVVKVPDGKCCPEIKCEPKKVCVYKNMVYEPGTNIPIDGCQECRCTLDVDPKTQLLMTKCQPVKCIEKCDPGYENIKKKPDDCCGECVKTHCIVTINGVDRTLKEGETLPSTNQGCDRFTCTKINGRFITNKYTVQCPPFNISNCQPGTVQRSSDGCCNVCVDQIKGCRVQTVRKYIQQKDCMSEKKMDLTFCSGDCPSFGRYSEPELSSCTCCQATQTSNRTVTLGCVNGDIITHAYINAEKCACSKANCHREDVGKTLTEDKK